jgi:hypothetical protein
MNATSGPPNVRVRLSDFGGPIYVGRPKGEAAREKLGLGAHEKTNAAVTIVVPPDTYAINSSFLLGMVGPAIKAAGTREQFLKKYAFEATREQREAFLNEAIDDAISHALIENVPLPGKGKRQ